MPHLPNPMGRYPLVLRDSNINNTKNGELLYNYKTDELMYSDLKTGSVNSVAKKIYDLIVSSRIENTTIEICKSSDEVLIDNPIIPDRNSRSMNTFYVNVIKTKENIDKE